MSRRCLSSGEWLTPARAWAGGRVVAALVLGCLALLAVVAVQQSLTHPGARPPALDFDAFWAAAHLAAHGHAASAYDNAVIEATERAATDMPPGYLAFYYPPTFLLLILPLGWLGYVPALVGFLAAESLLLIGLLRRILPQRWAWLPLLTWPGFLMNGLSGQNAPLSAAAFAAGALWLDRRPALAGACLGGLVCKPQLAVCVPIALAAARRWRALAACAGSAATLAALSWPALGTGVWRGFLANAPNARADIETIAIKWPKMQSLFGAIRLAGGGNAAAYSAQALLSAAAVALLLLVAVRRPGAALEASALATAALLFTPFLYDYDLLLLCVPMACLMAAAQTGGWRPWEKPLLAVVFLIPPAARAAGLLLGVIIGPPLLAALLLLLARRAGGAGTPAPAAGMTGFRRTALAALRDADWLTADRARAYGLLVAIMILIQAINLTGKIVASTWRDPAGRPMPTDFDAFWSGARLVLAGHPALAYDVPAMLAAQHVGAQPAPRNQFFPYLYPPVFLLLSAPLGLLPYLAAMAAFSLAGFAAITALLTRLLPRAWPILPVVVFPAAMMNATMGQNGALSALCFAGALLLLDRQPLLAGACLGMLAFKPHLALCVPLALLAARRWGSLGTCAGTAIGLAALSWAVLGSATWIGFFHSAGMARSVLTGDDTWPRLQSVYAALRILHGGPAAAAAAQAIAALLAAWCVVRVCARRPGAGPEMAVTAAACLLCTPYLFDYDLVVLGVPMGWLVASGSSTGWRGWEKLVLCAAYILPLEARNLNAPVGLPLLPALVAGVLGLVVMRAIRAGEAGADPTRLTALAGAHG